VTPRERRRFVDHLPNISEEQEDLSTRDYNPTAREKLFHYCAHETLWAILDSGSFWLSSIDGLNDRLELRWGRELTTRILFRHRHEFPDDLRLVIHATFAQVDLHLAPLIFSLSRNGDLLSQWRAYASDGRGIAIEFAAEKLSASTPVNMKDVLYSLRRQVSLLQDTLRIFASWWSLGDAGKTAVQSVLPDFAVDLLSLKHPSFFEEREVRMVHVVLRDGNALHDPGGHTDHTPSVSGVEVRYRQIEGVSRPYIALPIEAESLITGVVLGPKNPREPVDVQAALAARGLPWVRVRRSAAPYR